MFSLCHVLGIVLIVLHDISRIAQAAGARKKWVQNDVDLEALEPDELDVLVRLTLLGAL